MKRFFIGLFMAASLTASAQAYEGKVSYQKNEQPALIMEYNYPPDLVESAIKQKMEKMGLKGKSSKGFIVYSGATISDISSSPMDYAFKVERKSRRDKNSSIVYMVMNGANVLSAESNSTNSNGKYFLGNLSPDIESSSLEVDIKAQEDNLAKAEKKYKTMQDDKADMEKKIRKLQDDLKTNEKDQDNQVKELEKQRGVLEALKGRRK
jgi:hypothetical protein